jgi:hypothetical protein
VDAGPGTAPVVLEYRVSRREDLLAAFELARTHTTAQAIGAAAIFIGLLGLVVVPALVGLSILLITLGLSVVTGLPWLIATWRAWSRRPEMSGTPLHIEASGAGLRIASSDVDSRLAWASIGGVSSTRHFLVFDLGSGSYVIPLRVLADGQRAAILKFATENASGS